MNIIVHGHEPTLSDVIVAAASDPQLLAEAKAKGAKGINLAGICCTANEILMRHGIPIAGNFLQQELAVMTGAVDVMLVDIQCVFPALTRLQDCFHTKVVSTSSKAQLPGADAHRVPRRRRAGDRQADRPHRHRELSPIAIPPRSTSPSRKSRWWPASPPRWSSRSWAGGTAPVSGR